MTYLPSTTCVIESAVTAAVRDQTVKVIVLRGAGRAFCAGFNFSGGFHQWDDGLTTGGKWDPGTDFVMTCSRLPAGWRSS